MGMTVYPMPQATEALASVERARSGRWKMIGILLACAAPVIASYFTYYVVRPEGRRNFGELIDPQRTLPETTVRTLAGESVPLASLKGQWLLVSVAGGACDTACQNHLYLQRQLREGLGKDKDRLDWVWLVNDDVAPSEALRQGVQKATVLRMDPTALSAWLAPAAGHQVQEHLYVVDPMGNWMLRFPAGLDKSTAPKAKRDLERLMRASASWDKAGREGREGGAP